jgi:carboxypeptidase PM20D1
VKKIALAIGVGVVLITALVVVRAWYTQSRQLDAAPAAALAIDPDAAAAGLADAIRLQTVSHQDPANFDPAQFVALHRLLEQRFPRVHRALQRELVNDYSLLYTWPGRQAEEPVVLLAHIDVVPIESGTEQNWTHPPFAGAVADGFIWGRGALDDKCSAVAILEAVETLLAAGVVPPRTVIIALGHDEELNGTGASAMAERLRHRGVQPAFVLDEGGAVLESLIPGVAAPVATVSVGEKGYISIELTTKADGGHSSMPPRSTAIGVLSSAIERLEGNQMPANFAAAMGGSLDHLGPEMPFPYRLVLANLWLFGPLVEWQLSQLPQTNAAIRTTTAATIFEGGVKDNILPATARAVVNFRILPGDTIDSVVEHVRRVVDDPSVSVKALGGNDPGPMSSPDAPAFAEIARAIRTTFPGTIVTPSLALGATDARHYTTLSPNVYRFSPMRMTPADLARVHGTNERIAVADYANMIRFYAQLVTAEPPARSRRVEADPAAQPAGAGR